jgi:chemotaxis regulatin CheY-phosphate phosphatase CheZ
MNARDLAPGNNAIGQAADRLAGVTADGARHLDEVERDLSQMDALLDAAVQKLSTSFLAIHQLAVRQQQCLQELAQAGASATESAAALQSLREEIERHVATAVTGLQFQDLTSQLIGRMAGHVAGVREVLATLDAHAAALDAEGHTAHLSALAPLVPRIAAHGATMATHAPRKVVQQHMESGDIELF